MCPGLDYKLYSNASDYSPAMFNTTNLWTCIYGNHYNNQSEFDMYCNSLGDWTNNGTDCERKLKFYYVIHP